jgi:hypothetical protein
MHGRITILGTLLMLEAAAWSPAAGQDSAATIPTRKARVLAEAVSSYRHPGEFYLVGARLAPYTVVGAYATRDSAVRAARLAGRVYEATGPYRGPAERTPWEVLSVTVRIRGHDGREQTLEYDAKSVDAVFLTLPAVDKFMMPYYTRLYGRPYADSVRAAIIQPPPKPPCHRLSIPCWPPMEPIIRLLEESPIPPAGGGTPDA